MKTNLFDETISSHIEALGISERWSYGDALLDAAYHGAYKAVEPEKLASFLSDAVTLMNENNLVSIYDGEMPSDARVGMVYQPSYCAVTAAIYALLHFPALLDENTRSKLLQLMESSFVNGIVGHGFDADSLIRKVMLSLCRAGIADYLNSDDTDLDSALARHVIGYVANHESHRQTVASDDNPEGTIPVFRGYDGRANNYIRQFMAAWEGRPHSVFVYGTLLSGGSAHDYLKDSLYLGRFQLSGYHIFKLGSYPGIKEKDIEESGERTVFGEVYCVDEETLARLDRYEGEGSLYEKKTVRVSNIWGSVEADAYVYLGSTDGMPEMTEPWNSKDSDEVWYAAYGSNLQAKRFRCYLEGGCCEENGRTYPGCRDKTLWKESICRDFTGRMYFGNNSGSWNGGGVAFYSHGAGRDKVKMRLYKITRGQLHDIREQEGPSDNWYGWLTYLGNESDDNPIFTLTSKLPRPENDPAPAYLNLIRTALVTECGMKEEAADKYLRRCMKRIRPQRKKNTL